jgi:hypothetical protein
VCRFVAWSGAARYLEEFVFAPENSIVAQSRKALASKTPINADGFKHTKSLVFIKVLIPRGQTLTLHSWHTT